MGGEMTQREICERIIEDGDCGAIDCFYGSMYGGLNVDGPNCPCDCRGDCGNSVREAQRWLREHPEQKEKQ